MRVDQMLFSLVLLCVGSQTWSQAVAMDAELQLKAIRQALVETTLDKPTKVSATAWIDGDGKLHETAYFQTDARIRGVRVLAYAQNGEETPRASIDMETLPWSVRTAKSSAGETCEPPPQNWRQPLMIITHTAQGFSGPEKYMSHELMKQLSMTWQNLATSSGRWAIETPTPAASDTFHQLWLGQGEEPLGWQIQIQLMPLKSEVGSRWYKLGSWADVMNDRPIRRWTIRVTFGQKSSHGSTLHPHWTKSLTIEIPDDAISNQPQRWIKETLPELTTQFSDWIKSSHNDVCDPIKFVVNRNSGSNWVLEAGAGSGLKRGDRVLIVNSSKVPSRLLEPGTSRHMAIAEVVSVGKRQSELKTLAGPTPSGSGDWIALPL